MNEDGQRLFARISALARVAAVLTKKRDPRAALLIAEIRALEPRLRQLAEAHNKAQYERMRALAARPKGKLSLPAPRRKK